MTSSETLSNYLSVRKASQRLGVTPHRVRALVRNGEIEAMRISDRGMLIDAISVAVHEGISSEPGRPYKGQTAFGALWLLSGLNADWLSYQQHRRCRNALEELDCEELLQRCRKRARTVRLRVNDSFIEDAKSSLVRSGVSALGDYAFDLTHADDICEGYVDQVGLSFIKDDCFGVPDSHGNVIAHVAEFIPDVGGNVMPEAVVAADLAESLGSRQRVVGRTRLEELVNRRHARG